MSTLPLVHFHLQLDGPQHAKHALALVQGAGYATALPVACASCVILTACSTLQPVAFKTCKATSL